MKIVECVPNFSEGVNKDVLDAIAAAASSVRGCKVLDVDPGVATNRTVFTFAGNPEAVLEGTFQAIKVGVELIDMKNHKGAHARFGACDVCPFVPVSGITMAECAQLAKELGKRIGEELGIPIYLYAEAAGIPERKRLPDIRAGEYEALAEKHKDPSFKPDFGPAKFNPKSGVTAVGARKFLIAYNVNLNTSETRLAKKIALEIRENGKLKRDKDGKKMVGPNGKAERVPGRFKQTQATGWLIEEYGRAQVTINILDMDLAPLHEVFDACVQEAEKLGVRVTGSEIIGMIPRQALIDAGNHYVKKYNGNPGMPECDIARVAVQSLGLSEISEFNPEKKVIEYQFLPETPLGDSSVKGFCAELSRNSPAPGGGSVAALAGTLAAGLCSMVASLTMGKKKFKEVEDEMKQISLRAQEIREKLVLAIDEDTHAFNKLYACFSMPKRTEEDLAKKNEAIESATKSAAELPLDVMKQALGVIGLSDALIERGNQNSLSDAGVAAAMVPAAIVGAYYNVMINTIDYKDKDWAKALRKEAGEIMDKVQKEVKPVLEKANKKLS